MVIPWSLLLAHILFGKRIRRNIWREAKNGDVFGILQSANRQKEVNDVLRLDNKKVKQILVSELGYSEAGADRFMSSYPVINKTLANAVKLWLEDRTVLDTDFFGVTVAGVMKTQRYNFLQAIREINYLLDENMSDEKRKRMVEQLKKPSPRW